MAEKTEAEVISIIKSRLDAACAGEKVGSRSLVNKMTSVLDAAVDEGLISPFYSYEKYSTDIKVQLVPEVKKMNIEINFTKEGE